MKRLYFLSLLLLLVIQAMGQNDCELLGSLVYPTIKKPIVGAVSCQDDFFILTDNKLIKTKLNGEIQNTIYTFPNSEYPLYISANNADYMAVATSFNIYIFSPEETLIKKFGHNGNLSAIIIANNNEVMATTSSNVIIHNLNDNISRAPSFSYEGMQPDNFKGIENNIINLTGNSIIYIHANNNYNYIKTRYSVPDQFSTKKGFYLAGGNFSQLILFHYSERDKLYFVDPGSFRVENIYDISTIVPKPNSEQLYFESGVPNLIVLKRDEDVYLINNIYDTNNENIQRVDFIKVNYFYGR